jgi:hypothetical protein
VDLRHRLHKDRESGMKLCGELFASLQNAPKSDLLKSYSQRLSDELKRFETVSQQLCSKDKQFLEPIFLEEGGVGTPDSDYRQKHQQMLLEKSKLLSHDEMAQLDLVQMQEREKEILQVERDVTQIHEMFSDLRALVIEQGAELDSIEANITSVHEDVHGAYDNLEQAEDYQRRARNRKCCLMVVMTVVIALIILFLTKFITN